MEKFYVYQVKGAFYSEKLPFMEFNTLEEAEEYANQLTAQCNGRYSFFAN